MKRLLLFIAFLFIASGAIAMSARSPEQHVPKYDYESLIRMEIEKGISCQSDSDCVVVFPGCPFGCSTVLNVKSAEKVKSMVADYFKQYANEQCVYKCAQVPKTYSCIDNICQPGVIATISKK